MKKMIKLLNKKVFITKSKHELMQKNKAIINKIVIKKSLRTIKIAYDLYFWKPIKMLKIVLVNSYRTRRIINLFKI